MKPLITLLSLILITSASYAQNEILITYDEAGNRIRREIVPPSKVPTPKPRVNSRAETDEVAAMQEAQKETGNTEDTSATPPTLGETVAYAAIVYPNPTLGQVEVQTTGEFMQLPEKKFAVYDLNGKLLQLGEVTKAAFPVNLSGYKAGTYIIRLTAVGYQDEWKIVKQ